MSLLSISQARLYGILDLGYVSAADAPTVAQKMIEAGVDLVQLRAKKLSVEHFAKLARELAPIFANASIPFILNDHPELVAETGATGAHVGQDDLTVAEARRLAGPGAIIGQSTHSLEQARLGGAQADYIGFGPLLATPTKPDYTPIGLNEIKTAIASVQVPVFCIGGIKLENLPTILAAGAQRVVIVSGLLQANDLVAYGRAVKNLLMLHDLT